MTRKLGWGVMVCLAGVSAFLASCAGRSATTVISPSRAPEVYVPTSKSTPIPPTPTATRSPTPEPTPFVCDEPGGRSIQTTYPGAVLPQEIPVRVYLPACYDRVPDRYPVVILLHGWPFTESHWEDLGVVKVVDQGILEEGWHPFIMAMPLQPEPLFTHTDGGADSYEAELVQGLLPYVEKTFRTARDPAARAIAGISRGGVWALEIGFRNPQVFGEVAALSPALAVNYARPAYDPLEIAESGSATLPARIFLGAGDVDWARQETLALGDALTASGGAPDLQIVSGDHVSATWQALMPAMFRYLTAPWASLPP